MAQALEASSRVDAEMVAGAVKGALVDVCAERHTLRKTAAITKSGTFPPLSSFVFPVCCDWLWVMTRGAKKGF